MDIYFAQKHIRHENSSYLKSLDVGTIVINAFHNPNNPGSNVGLYLIICDYENLKCNYSTYFAINLRTNITYTYEQLESHLRKHGFYFADINTIELSIRKK